MEYLPRSIDKELDEFFPYVPALCLDGPKGVGKTETAKRRAKTTLQLDTAVGRALYAADTSLAFFEKPLLVDEWQEAPDVWNSIRHSVDSGVELGSYIITGSASPRDKSGTHTGAGRILSLRMRPMGLHERGLGTGGVKFSNLFNPEYIASGTSEAGLLDYVHEIVSSGFPGIRALPQKVRRRHIDSYIQLIIDRDLPEGGYAPRNPVHLRRWLESYAAATATTASFNTLSKAVSGDGEYLSKDLTRSYREHLARIWILDSLPGWIPAHNDMKRISQAPKHFLADPALAASLLGVTEKMIADEKKGKYLGQFFEALSVLTIRVMAQTEEMKCYHLRTHNGIHEVDMILERPEGGVLAVEVKAKTTPTLSDSRHISWLQNQRDDVIGGVIISTGQHAYRLENGVNVVPLAMLEL